MTYTEIVKKLIGEITPAGRTEVDEVRLENLKEFLMLTDNLMDEIIEVSKYVTRQEHSMKTIGETAKKFLNRWSDFLNDEL